MNVLIWLACICAWVLACVCLAPAVIWIAWVIAGAIWCALRALHVAFIGSPRRYGR